MSTNQANMQGQDNFPPRGRGSGNRGRSSSRTRGGGRNYASQSVQNQALQQQQRIEQTLLENQQRSQQAANKPKPDVSGYIEAGKIFVSKFFKGFQQEKRGNIQVTLDDTLPERVSEVYYDRITEMLSELHSQQQPQAQTRLIRRGIKRFAAGITLATAIKLYKSSTELEKTANFNLNVLHRAKINIPEKLAVIINQLGKTDLKDDNRIRIENQHMATKRMCIKAICRHYNSADLAPFLDEMQHTNGLAVAHLYNNVFGANFNRMIDNSLKSLSLLRQISKEYFESKQDINFRLNVFSTTRANNVLSVDTAFDIKLPHFDFKDADRDRVVQYLANPIFNITAQRHFDWTDHNAVVNVICALTCQIATTAWIRRPATTLGVLDNGFVGTPLENITFLHVMNSIGIWNINNFISDSDINELLGDMLHNWNSTSSLVYGRVLKMKEMEFSEFGTDSQMVEISDESISDTQYMQVNRYQLKKKPKAEVSLKISETGATFGLMSKFITGLKMKSDFVINHDSNNRNILREFLKTDILK